MRPLQSTLTRVQHGVYQLTFARGAQPLRYCDVLGGLCVNRAFCTEFNEALASAPLDAFFFETPAISLTTREQVFECMLTEAPRLVGLSADAKPFESAFATAVGAHTVSFANLGADAMLVAPTPPPTLEAHAAYAHLATFSRSASADRIAAFWRAVGIVVEDALDYRPRWVSTSGLGVAWLHMRIDTRPKYYVFEPYKSTRVGP